MHMLQKHVYKMWYLQKQNKVMLINHHLILFFVNQWTAYTKLENLCCDQILENLPSTHMQETNKNYKYFTWLKMRLLNNLIMQYQNDSRNIFWLACEL